jgi:hypothetical protein
MYHSRNRLINKSVGVLLLQLISSLLLCQCQTYHLSNGEKYRNWFPVKDEYIVNDSLLFSNNSNYLETLSEDTTRHLFFIQSQPIIQFIDSINKNLLLIFYYPNCSGSIKELEIAKFAELHKINYLLISDTYSPNRMSQLYEESNLVNQNLYILPTITNDKVLIKKLTFIKEICPELYNTHKDNLIFTSLLIISPNETCKINPIYGKGFAVKDSLIDWLKLQYNIQN